MLRKNKRWSKTSLLVLSSNKYISNSSGQWDKNHSTGLSSIKYFKHCSGDNLISLSSTTYFNNCLGGNLNSLSSIKYFNIAQRRQVENDLKEARTSTSTFGWCCKYGFWFIICHICSWLQWLDYHDDANNLTKNSSASLWQHFSYLHTSKYVYNPYNDLL